MAHRGARLGRHDRGRRRGGDRAGLASGGDPAALIADLTDFRARRGLDRVVVVNLASTGPPAPPEHQSLPALEKAMASGLDVLMFAQRALRVRSWALMPLRVPGW